MANKIAKRALVAFLAASSAALIIYCWRRETRSAFSNSDHVRQESIKTSTLNPSLANTNKSQGNDKANALSSKALRDEVDKMRSSLQYANLLRAKRQQYYKRFARYIAKHSLTADQAAKLIDLLIAYDNTYTDLRSVIKEQGINASAADLRSLRQSLTVPIDSELAALLGNEAYADLSEYRTILAYRMGYIEPMLPAVAALADPLDDAQIDMFATILHENEHPGPPINGNPAPESHVDMQTSLEQGANIFTPAQYAAIESYLEGKKPH